VQRRSDRSNSQVKEQRAFLYFLAVYKRIDIAASRLRAPGFGAFDVLEERDQFRSPED